jgi:serine/threonine-protein kinase RsbW
MRMTVRLDLPRDAGSVPTVRRLLRCALSVLHVDGDSGDDLEIAITEACANVVDHATGAETFEVSLDVGEGRCAIDVRDDGAGFDPEALETGTPGSGSERGRGLFLIRALSENVRMHSVPRKGSLIHFEKTFA